MLTSFLQLRLKKTWVTECKDSIKVTIKLLITSVTPTVYSIMVNHKLTYLEFSKLYLMFNLSNSFLTPRVIRCL